MKRIDWALVFLTPLIMFIAASGAAIASWDQPQITLTPGTWQTIEFTNTENRSENLTITNVSAPDVLLPFVLVSPASIPALSSENIIIQFAYIPSSVRESIPKDVFAVHIAGLLVYLDCSIPLPENAENRWAALEARIDALETSLTGQIESFASRIAVLESTMPENPTSEIEAIRENLDNLKIWVVDRIIALETNIYDELNERIENSTIDTSEWETMLEEQEAQLKTDFAGYIADMKIDYEGQMAERKAENDRSSMVSYGAIVAAVVALVITLRSKITMPSLKLPKRHSMVEVASKDKVAMLENEIATMKERGDPEDAIRKKEAEMKVLKARQELEKMQGDQDV